jgi:hypothetical protein
MNFIFSAVSIFFLFCNQMAIINNFLSFLTTPFLQQIAYPAKMQSTSTILTSTELHIQTELSKGNTTNVTH